MSDLASLRVDSRRILQDARALAFPRYPGTEGDRRAIEIVARKLEEAGLEVQRESFSYDVRPAFRALRTLILVAALLVGGAGFLAPVAPLTAAAMVAAALVSGGAFLSWAPWLEKVYRGEGPTLTANVVGRRPAAPPLWTLIFVAHHDSKSQNLTMPVRGGLTLVAIVGGLSLLLLLVGSAIRGQAPRPEWVPYLLGGTAAAALLILSTLTSGNASPGGVDNAGSLGILLELARLLTPALEPEVELIFLSPGAEEDHMVGAMRWLDAHLDELQGRPVLAINFDGAGIPGRVVLLERYGFGQAFSPRLSRAARRAAAGLGLAPRGVFLPPAMGLDAIPFAHRGIECLTLASGSLHPATLAVHSAADVADHLSEAALADVARLAVALAAELRGSIGVGISTDQG